MPEAKGRGIFYGYWIVVVCFFCLFLTSGAGFYAFGIFFKPLVNEFGWSRGAVSLAFTILFLVQGAAGPFIGRLVDLYGPGRVIALGGFISGLAFIMLRFTMSLHYFYAAYVLLGIGFTGLGIIPSSAAVSSWFARGRGAALGITTTGIGIGGLVFSPLIGAYLIPSFGWRDSYLFLGVLTWVLIIPGALLIVKNPPWKAEALPYGEYIAEAEPGSSDRWTFKAAMATPTFWLIALAFFASNMSSVGVVQHQVNYLTDIGFPVAQAATALGFVGLGSAVGKFAFGYLSDRLAARYCAAISFSFQAIAILILLNLRSGFMLWPYSILMGLGVGGWAPLTSMLIGGNFGLLAFGAIYGMLNMVQSLGVAAGPFIAGYIYDTGHSYHPAFLLFLVLYALATPAVLAARRPRPRG